jgi:hypothetical protein
MPLLLNGVSISLSCGRVAAILDVANFSQVIKRAYSSALDHSINCQCRMILHRHWSRFFCNIFLERVVSVFGLVRRRNDSDLLGQQNTN